MFRVKQFLLAIILVINISLSHTAECNEFETFVVVELVGLLSVETFSDARGEMEKGVILSLHEPIDVKGDEFGDRVNGITNIQIVYLGGDRWKIEKYIGKKIKINGKLFHAHTAHHHTKVLLEVRANSGNIAIEN